MKHLLPAIALMISCSLSCVVGDVIQRLEDVRSLSDSEAAENLPVKVVGVVTWCRFGRISGGFMFEQNGSGCFVVTDHDLPDGRKHPAQEDVRNLVPGDAVEVEGVTRAGGYAPTIWAATVRVVGKQPVPKGKEVGLGHLFTGTYDTQRVALRGVITGCQPSEYGDGTWVMVLAGASGKARAVVPAMPGMSPEDIEDAAVEISGVVFTRCNSRKEFVGVSIETNRVEDVRIYNPGGREPFSVPLLEVGRLRALVPGGYSQHRRRIIGVVTLSKPGLLYLQGPTGGTRVVTRKKEVSHTVGEWVEAAGFVESYEGRSQLASAVTRKKADGELSRPLDLSVADDKDPAERDGMLVRMKGVLLESHGAAGGTEMVISDSGKSFKALLSGALAGGDALVNGSDVSLTGVAEMTYELGPYFPDGNMVSSLRLLLRSPEDIVIRHVPPWWNAGRLLYALALAVGTAGLLGGAALWLVRKVRTQSNQLATEALAHRQVTAAHSAMMEERARLAGEMHDGLQPMLSGLAFFLDAADTKLVGPLPEGARDALERSRTLLVQIREEFRQCIWCLYELGRQTGDLANELRRLARVQRQWSHAEVNTEITGEPFPLPPSISRGLLLACQEAVENATRHGKAEHIEIRCAFEAGGLEIVVRDDGRGFDVSSAGEAPGSHFGLSGMRQRVERLGGTLAVTSAPGSGTVLTMSLCRDVIYRVDSNPLVSSTTLPSPSQPRS